MQLSEFNKSIWLWLLGSGGYWTAEEVASRTGNDPQKVFRSLSAMERRELVCKRKSEFQRKLSYGVEGTCLVPKGLRLAEVQE